MIRAHTTIVYWLIISPYPFLRPAMERILSAQDPRRIRAKTNIRNVAKTSPREAPLSRARYLK
jgi:hypothetical protein